MDFSEYVDRVVSFAQNNTIISIVIGLAILYFMYRKTSLFFTILILGLLLMGLYYLITSMATSGGDQKRKLIPKDEKDSVQIPDRFRGVNSPSSRPISYKFLQK